MNPTTVRFSKTIVAVAIGILSAAMTLADTCTWQGGSSGKFNVAGNWDTLPVSGRGDALVFPENGTFENDMTGLTVASVTMTGGGTLSGNKLTFTVAGDAFVADAAVTVTAPLDFQTGGTAVMKFSSSGTSYADGAITLAGDETLKISRASTVWFRGGITGLEAALDFAVTASFFASFFIDKKPLAVKKLLHSSGSNWPYGYLYFNVGGNTILETPQLWSFFFWVQTADCFTDRTVLGFADNCYKDKDTAGINFNGGSSLADRIESPANLNYGKGEPRDGADKIYSSKGTLTLKGSANASTYALIGSVLSLVWDPKDDFTQTFINREHTTTGSLTVKGGALKMDGTCKFASVPSLDIHDGARFQASVTNTGALAGLATLNLKGTGRLEVVPTAQDLFTAGKVVVTADAGSRIVLPQGAALAVKSVMIEGAVSLSAGTYTGIGHGSVGMMETSLVEGPGVLTVAESASPVVGQNVTVWTGAEGTAWENAANWTDGLPSATVKGIVSSSAVSQPVISDATAVGTIGNVLFTRIVGNAVTVEVRTAADFSGGDFKIADGATVSVTPAGTFRWNAASRGVSYLTETSSIDAGGALESFGTVDLNMTGQLAVRGRLSVSNGQMTVENDNGYAQLMLKDGGRLEASGSAVVDVKRAGGLDAEEGGSIVFKDDAVLNMPAYWKGTELGSADLFFSGRSRMTNPSTSVIYLNPKGANESFRLKLTDLATVVWPQVHMRGQEGGSLVEFDYDTDATNSVTFLSMGASWGTSRLYLRRGNLTLGSRLFMSGGFTCYQNAPSKADSELIVTGGSLTIGGSSEYTAFSGLHIGDGAIDVASAGSSALFRIEGGEVVHACGPVVIGSGNSRGTMVMTGGSFQNKSTYGNNIRPVLIGFEGGTGELAVSNGTFTVPQPIYVGGALTNNLRVTSQMAAAGYGSHHDAIGTLTVAQSDLAKPCMVTSTYDVVFGQDGTGSLAVGAGGVLAAKGVTFCGASAATFVFGANGVGCVTAKDRLTVSSDAKLTVDASACTDWSKKYWLFRCTETAGTFAEANITLVTGATKNLVLRQRPTGVYVMQRKGLSVLVR